MNEIEIQTYYQNNIIAFEKLGEFVTLKIKEKLFQDKICIDSFLKLPIYFRIKKLDSIIEKVFYRKKYVDPIAELTDIVGVRLVVLSYEELEITLQLINELFEGNVVIDRNYKDEREANPYIFDYQSVHFILKFTNQSYEGVNISNISCEIQVRTILQHAYAELTHDLIYKTDVKINQPTKRMASRSMALIESADCLFVETKSEVNKLFKLRNELISDSLYYFSKYEFELNYNEKLNFMIYEQVEEKFKNNEIESYIKYLISSETKLMQQAVIIKGNELLFYKQPMILTIYYLIDNGKLNWLNESWSFDQKLLDIICDNMGISN